MTALLVGPTRRGPRERTYRALLRAVRFVLHLCTRRTQRGDEHLLRPGP